MEKDKTIQQHWEKVYREKQPNEVSWWQEHPKTSLEFIHLTGLSKNARIIDIGGGDSKLVDFLLDEGYQDITVLDISAQAIERAKNRLGKNAHRAHWVVSDVNEFHTDEVFDVWHDRAAFHFMNTEQDRAHYKAVAERSIVNGGYLILGTFSTSGPIKCSGLPVHQYDERSLLLEFQSEFEKISCITENHITPFGTVQNFLFCSLRKK